MKYVLTGSPCTGKTTTINFFHKNGYQTVQEAASILIEEELRSKKNKPLWETNIKKFQQNLIRKQIEFESKINPFEITFVDRGIVDTIAYCKIFKSQPDQNFIDLAETNRYSNIFILDFLKTYDNNGIRLESQREARKIQAVLIQTYEEFGYKPIVVPADTIKNRFDFIINNISNTYLENNLIRRSLNL